MMVTYGSPCQRPARSGPAATFRHQAQRGDITLWFLGGEDNHGGQAHHHHDKLSVSLHAFGEVVSSDPGMPGLKDNAWSLFLQGSFAHNTLVVDEADQGPMVSEGFEAHLDAEPPWARAAVRGDRTGYRESLWKVMLHRGDEVREGVCDGVSLERTVFFDPPRIVLSDRCEAEAERRFGFVFHARGSLVAQASLDGDAEPSPLAPLPSEGSYGLFTGRQQAYPARQFIADWRLRPGLWLRLVAASDGPFEATWGRTPGNPRGEDRGTVVLRAVGRQRRFATVLELHRGAPALASVASAGPSAVETVSYGGASRRYEA